MTPVIDTPEVLRILHLEDSPLDAELIRERLIDAGFSFDIDWAADKEQYIGFLQNGCYHLILADYNLPGFEAPAALELAGIHCPGIPFICVSGAVGEEKAVDLLKQGATDYVPKNRPEKLSMSIRRALDEVRERKARRLAEAENIKLSEQLQQSQKMESVGRLAGGVAHDFNNMLGVILGHAELGLMRLEPDHPVRNALTEILKAAERSADLTRQLLAFARKQIVVPKELNLNDTVAGMLKMLQRLIGENIVLTWQPAAGLWPVMMDPSQLDQILANLCVNARDAIEGSGRISIETENCTIDSDYCTASVDAIPGEYVRLTVSDNGIGMDRETVDLIFEPFFTTKALGKGTGLGLSTVYGIVKQNNGFINIYTEPGQGAAFSVHLPRHAAVNRKVQADEPAGLVQRGNETILLVEDEPAILNIATIMLEKQGYTVLKAITAGEAIRIARAHPDLIHLLMTDVIMPEMNGRDLSNELLSLYPRMKRLFMSGYTADVIGQHGVLDEGVHFIQKPFSLIAMAAKVREVLDAANS